ncbi:MAG: MerR family transcriptional regulator [Lachnospiraceae bacterium]|nr:MerR family transcriptional regulator [Lachnospiraceae bacterium]
MTYTAGELAKKLGISARTVRFYDEKNLLSPLGYSEAGYRLYNDGSAERLQKILMLRFMDFSIEQIEKIMQQNHFNVKESLEEQERLLLAKKQHIEQILSAVKKTKDILAIKPDDIHKEDGQEPKAKTWYTENTESDSATKKTDAKEEDFWENMRRIVDITRKREYVISQYEQEHNLQKRISLHDYSTASVGFYPWMLGKIGLAPNMKILDIGCGNAAFWRNVASRLPENLEIHLVDYSTGMLESAGKNMQEIKAQYPEKHLHYILDRRDATDFSYPVSGFDRIMANHLLFHLNKEARSTLYQKINALLKDGGHFSCSLIGKNHLFELHKLIYEHYPQIKIPSDSFDIFLENAGQELCQYFTVIETEEQKNDLLVPDEQAVLNYVASYSDEIKEIITKDREQFLSYVRGKMNQDGLFYIHKSTGLVICNKIQ